jgi:prepilin-type N-terminal cleavage/methylation domain-containing protein
MPTTDCRRQSGFTLLELVIVVMVLGIFGGIAVPMLTQAAAQTKLDAAADAVVSSLNYARLRALNSQQNYRVVFDTGAERMRVEMNANNKLSQMKDPSRSVMSAHDVENEKSWVDVQHPLETMRTGGRNYVITFSQEPAYQGVDLFLASFSGSGTVTFSPQGLPSTGGSVVLRLGGRQRTVTLQATTGTVSVS